MKEEELQLFFFFICEKSSNAHTLCLPVQPHVLGLTLTRHPLIDLINGGLHFYCNKHYRYFCTPFQERKKGSRQVSQWCSSMRSNFGQNCVQERSSTGLDGSYTCESLVVWPEHEEKRWGLWHLAKHPLQDHVLTITCHVYHLSHGSLLNGVTQTKKCSGVCVVNTVLAPLTPKSRCSLGSSHILPPPTRLLSGTERDDNCGVS